MTTTQDELSTIERDMLELERLWWRYPAAKETEIRERFGWSAVRYYQVLNTLLDKPATLAADPVLVRRLRRLRDTRRSARSKRA